MSSKKIQAQGALGRGGASYKEPSKVRVVEIKGEPQRWGNGTEKAVERDQKSEGGRVLGQKKKTG